MSTRRAGLLLHPTSLPGRFGVGDLGPSTESFLDWAATAGLRLWQVLPLGPTGYGGAPYGCLSAFAGNPLLVSPERLAEEGLVSAVALADAPAFSDDAVDFNGAAAFKETLFRLAFERMKRGEGRAGLAAERAAFEAENESWLDDYALFAALKARFGGKDFRSWDGPVSRHEPEAVEAAREELASEVDYHRFLQFLFFSQWNRLRKRATDLGIATLGDIPIYVSPDSADVWARRELFTVKPDGTPLTIAGVPPDYFSATGQLWGNPLYRWDALEAEGFSWWIERIRQNFRLTDLVRIDHFRGLAGFWEVKAGAKTAVQGRWVPAPGSKLFAAVKAALGDLPLVAEDLGVITPDVRALLEETGFPGMRILQFAFDDLDHEYAPHRHVPNAVVYTGTHDNDTTRGWFEKASATTRRRALDYLGATGVSIEWDLIRAAFTSVAETAVVPAQDVFSLGSEARMNTPGKSAGNWTWRARRSELTEGRAERLRRLADLSGRLPRPKRPEDAVAPSSSLAAALAEEEEREAAVGAEAPAPGDAAS